MSERLNKYLAFHLGISRREADDYISRGDVTINGEKAILGARIPTPDPDTAETSAPQPIIAIKGKPVVTKTTYTYIALNKPAGYVSSRKQQGDVPTLYSLLPKKYHTLKPVGRLDKDSSGLLLLTDDGDFAYRMTHPKFYKTKQYIVTISPALAPLHQQMINDFGIHLDDGPSKLTLEKLTDDRTTWRVTMHEGRNRQIRRTFAALGYTVTSLHRTEFGDYALGTLKEGEYQEVQVRGV